MPEQVKLALSEQLFRPGQRIGIAVSGGADSIALLRALLGRREALGLVLSVVHVHHGIRGEEADRDQDFVETLAAHYDLALHLRRVDTTAYASKRGQTLEEAARGLRYAFFRELMASGKVEGVATAHTLEDQAETVLQKLLRGAWTEGLGGISPLMQEEQGQILRPFLQTRRADIGAYLQALHQPWCEDSTNQSDAYNRNRIRHTLLPALRSFNPQIETQLGRMAAIARDEEAWWQRELARVGPRLVLPGKPVRGGGRAASTHPEEKSIALELDRLRPLGPAMQRRLLRWAAEQMHCALDFDHTEGLMQLCGFSEWPGRPTGKRLDLEGSVYAQRTAREIEFLCKPAIQTAIQMEMPLPIPGEVTLADFGLRFAARLKSGESEPGEAAVIRFARPGDRVTPRYTRGPKKIKEVLERLRLSAEERGHTPLVAWKGQVLWLRGVELEPSTLPHLPFTLEVSKIER